MLSFLALFSPPSPEEQGGVVNMACGVASMDEHSAEETAVRGGGRQENQPGVGEEG